MYIQNDRYLLYAPLTPQQKELYDAVVNRQIRSFLINRKSGDSSTPASSAPSTPKPNEVERVTGKRRRSTPLSGMASPAASELDAARPKRKRTRKSYVEKTDEDWFDELDEGNNEAEVEEEEELEEVVRLHNAKSASGWIFFFSTSLADWRLPRQTAKSVNAMHLQNLIMQLRKVCNHVRVDSILISHRYLLTSRLYSLGCSTGPSIQRQDLWQ
jgi:ATP-dependent DNA helicase